MRSIAGFITSIVGQGQIAQDVARTLKIAHEQGCLSFGRLVFIFWIVRRPFVRAWVAAASPVGSSLGRAIVERAGA